MNGKVVKIGEDPKIGKICGAEIGDTIFPIPCDQIDIRLLKPGDEVGFITTREGDAEIILPEPCIGCERGR